MHRRRRPRRAPLSLARFAPAVVLVVVGLAVLAVGGDAVVADAVALALVGVGGVLGVAAAFWEIGASEDRERRAGRS
jgi:hypothetical protein